MSCNVLVTGGAGYIGSMVCKMLSQYGFSPICFDNLFRGHEQFVKWGPLFVGDLKNIEDLRSAFQKYQPKAVIHMAALAYVVESMHHPDLYYQNNVLGSFNLFNIMNEYSVRTIVFSSSCATYGTPKETPIKETHPQNPINPYGRSKYFVEQILKDLSETYQLNYAILRYFNAAGADTDAEIGEMHEPETHLIPLLIQTAMGQQEKITIYGNDFPTIDNTAIRDYIHVMDLARAHILALKHLFQNRQNFSVNLGCGKGYSVLEVLRAVEKILKKQVPFVFAKKRPCEPAILIAGNAFAKKLLNFSPKHSDIKSMIESAYKWQEKSLNYQT